MSADRYLHLVLHTQKQEMQTFDKRNKINTDVRDAFSRKQLRLSAKGKKIKVQF